MKGDKPFLSYNLLPKLINKIKKADLSDKIDRILNTSKYIARKKDVKTRPYIFCAVNCPTVKVSAEKNGVIIIDLSDIQKIYQLFKEEKYQYNLDSIFKDEFRTE